MVFAKGLIGKTAQFLPGATDTTGSMVAQASTTAANLSANSYLRSGFTFTGWNTAEDGTGTPYGAGANFDFLTDLTLYAQWELTSSGGGGGGGSGTSDAEALATTGGVEPSFALWAGLVMLGVGVGVAMGIARRRG
jgi:hypothetical protein